MKKHVFGRQFNRDTNERKALFKGLVNALVMEESITTTEAKARAIRGQVEKLITKAKNRKEESKKFLQPWLQANALEKVMSDLATRFADRPGGYTRIVKLGERFGDNASMAVIEFVEKREKVQIIAPKRTKKEAKEAVQATAKAASPSAKATENKKKEEKPKAKKITKKESK